VSISSFSAFRKLIALHMFLVTMERGPKKWISLGQWWRTYGTRARGGTHSPLCGPAYRRSSTEFVTRKVEWRGARLLPRSGQPP